MSGMYDSLYVKTEPVDEDVAEEPSAPSYPLLESAPPIEQLPEGVIAAAHRERTQRHDATCAMCMLDLPTGEAVLRTTLKCNHAVCMKCAGTLMALTEERRPKPPCIHCREIKNDTSMASASQWASAAHPVFPEAQHEACVSELKRLLSIAYPGIWSNYDEVLDRPLQERDHATMLGADAFGKVVGTQIANSVMGAVASVRRVFSRPAEQTAWSALDDVNEQREAAPREQLPTGDAFVAEMLRRGRTLDTVFSTMRLTCADVYKAGVDTIEQLRKLGFDERRHFKGGDRSVVPILLLVDRFGYSAPDHMRNLSNYELAACGLQKCEVRILGLTAAELVRRGATITDMSRFALSLGDWVCYGDMQLTHALAMGFNAANTAIRYPDCFSEVPQNPATKLYLEICEAYEAQPMTRTQAEAARDARAAEQRRAAKKLRKTKKK